MLHGRRLTGGYTLFRTKGTDWMMHRERQPLPGILQPMLARSEPDLPPDDGRAEPGRLLLDDTPALLAPDRHEAERWVKLFGTKQIAASPELALAAALEELSRGRAIGARQLVRPAAALTGRVGPSIAIAALAVAAIAILAVRFVWGTALRRYSGASG